MHGFDQASRATRQDSSKQSTRLFAASLARHNQSDASLFLSQPADRNQTQQRLLAGKGHACARPVIQPKLKISAPEDAGEREADRAAEAVMRMPDDVPTLSAVDHGVVARQINPFDFADSQPPEELPAAFEESEEETLQRKAANGTASQQAPSALSPSIDRASRSGGRPLPNATRQFMESRFGYDFRPVRVHTDQTAATLAQQLRARAFTTGNRIFFAPGEFQPERSHGKLLLAHELAHVVQQNRGSRGVDRQIQRKGIGCMNCPPYCSYDSSVDLNAYNCAGLAHRTYDFKSLSATKAALAAGAAVACGDPCSTVGEVKHWLWEYDIRVEDSGGKPVSSAWRDFHTVAGPTAGDPLPMDSDEAFTKNGKRKVYGPGTGPSFKPPAKDPATKNEPAETPMLDGAGKPLYKVRWNFTESCYCLPCPPAPKKSP